MKRQSLINPFVILGFEAPAQTLLCESLLERHDIPFKQCRGKFEGKRETGCYIPCNYWHQPALYDTISKIAATLNQQCMLVVNNCRLAYIPTPKTFFTDFYKFKIGVWTNVPIRTAQLMSNYTNIDGRYYITI